MSSTTFDVETVELPILLEIVSIRGDVYQAYHGAKEVGNSDKSV